MIDINSELENFIKDNKRVKVSEDDKKEVLMNYLIKKTKSVQTMNSVSLEYIKQQKD